MQLTFPTSERISRAAHEVRRCSRGCRAAKRLFNCRYWFTGHTARRTALGLAQPSVDLANDAIVVLAPDGVIAAHAFVWDSAPHIRSHLSADVHPAYRGRGIGVALCAWGEAHAQQAIGKAPEGVRVAVREFILGSDEAARTLLAFVLVRAESSHAHRAGTRRRLSRRRPPA